IADVDKVVIEGTCDKNHTSGGRVSGPNPRDLLEREQRASQTEAEWNCPEQIERYEHRISIGRPIGDEENHVSDGDASDEQSKPAIPTIEGTHPNEAQGDTHPEEIAPPPLEKGRKTLRNLGRGNAKDQAAELPGGQHPHHAVDGGKVHRTPDTVNVI